MLQLEEALRVARGITRINVFRNRARGSWEAAIARNETGTQFAIGIGDDPVEALLRGLAAHAAGQERDAAPAKDAGKSVPPLWTSGTKVGTAPRGSGAEVGTAPAFSGGIFG